MKRKKNKSCLPRLIILILLLVLGITSYNLNNSNRKLKRKLSNIEIVTIKNDSLKIVDGFQYEGNEILASESFLYKGMSLKSPFNDGNSFEVLVKDKIRSRWQDNYGCRRRTGNVKRIHEGIDLFVPENSPVYPIGKIGIVTEISKDPHHMITVEGEDKDGNAAFVGVEYGKIVRVAYPEGFESLYAHLNKVSVEKGDTVYAKTELGLTGVTGNLVRSGKPSHLHLEVRDSKNKSFDPKKRILYEANPQYFYDILKKNKKENNNGN